MPKVDLKLSFTTEANKKGTTTISDVNPGAGRTPLLQLSQKINALTTNTYNETNRVETVNLDTEAVGGNQRALTVTNAKRGATAQLDCTTYDGESGINPRVFYYIPEESSTTRISPNSVSSGDPTIARYTFTIPSYNGTLYVGTAATGTYLANFISVTVES